MGSGLLFSGKPVIVEMVTRRIILSDELISEQFDHTLFSRYYVGSTR